MRPVAEETGLVLDAADAISLARRLRTTPAETLARLSPAMLRNGAGNLRAAAYSLTTAARAFEHAANLKDPPT